MIKPILTVMITFMVALQLRAEDTNSVAQPMPPAEAEAAAGKKKDPEKKSGQGRNTFRKRQLRLLEKALDEIGVEEEQRQQIITLQETHMKKMKANWKRMNTARRELSRLQDEGASMEELDAAIKEVSNAQTAQLRILVRHRKEMERILGKEKSDLFMEKAHEYFRQHGRPPGAGLPPHPNAPPIPGKDDIKSNGPPPPSVNSTTNSPAPPLP
jgi:hypothetical protein